MKKVVITILMMLVFMVGCSTLGIKTWKQVRLDYCEANIGTRPASILKAMRSNKLAEGMTEREAYLVSGHYYDGERYISNYHVGGVEYKTKILYNSSGTSSITLIFRNGYLESWDRSHYRIY